MHFFGIFLVTQSHSCTIFFFSPKVSALSTFQDSDELFGYKVKTCSSAWSMTLHSRSFSLGAVLKNTKKVYHCA